MKLTSKNVIATLLIVSLSVLYFYTQNNTNESKILEKIAIGSKNFTESVILGEILTHLSGHAGTKAHHQAQLGGTSVLWNALIKGELDAYPEYTGTLIKEILAKEGITTEDELVKVLARYGLRMTPALGFNNTYAIGVKRSLAKKMSLRTISDLKKHPQLIMGFTNEFMKRTDGWPGLQRLYQLPQKNVRGLDHDLAYRGIESNSLQVIDLYATDAEIDYYKLYTLKDDKNYFPVYNAVILYRIDLEKRAPKVVKLFNRLAGRINAVMMTRMNSQVKIQKTNESVVAADFLRRSLNITADFKIQTASQRFWQHTGEHLLLVGVSLTLAILIAIPLGIIASAYQGFGKVILSVAEIIQTIPSLALFVFMIPLLGIGGPPAIVALFLYSLLPIIRNTYTGLKEIPADIRESMQAIGLPAMARLKIVEMPMAMRSIMAGIKIAAVINVGTATLGALIGAGGYGQPILTGIRLDDTSLILQGAIPAAILALLVQGLFEIIERRLLPRERR